MGSLQLFGALCLFHYVGAFSVRHPFVGVVGGHEIPISDAPFMASVARYRNKTAHNEPKMIFCGGSVIHERFILSAAHCFMFDSYRDTIKVGTSLLNNTGPKYEVEKVIIHENFSPSDSAFSHDIALVKVKENISFSENVSKIALGDECFSIEPFTPLNVTGWGITEVYGRISNELRQVTAEIRPKDDCKIYPWVSNEVICIFSHNRGSCKGDSGGPITLGDVQVGIISHGLGCGIFPTVNTKISFLRSWIDENIKKIFSSNDQ